MVKAVMFRRLIQAARHRNGPVKILAALLFGIALGHVDQFACFNGFQLDPKGTHQFTVESSAKAEALRCVADGRHAEGTHRFFDSCSFHALFYGSLHFIFIGRAEDIGKGTVIKSTERVGC